MATSTSLLSRTLASPTTRTAATAAVGVLAVILVAAGIHRAQRQVRVRSLKRSIPEDGKEGSLSQFGIASSAADEESFKLAARAQAGDFDEDIILEQLSRNRLFLGDAGLQSLRNAFIIVVGLGGVGSHAATMLLRSGASNLRLIDFDQVTLSSLNRHAVATLSDVGTPKVHALRKHLLRIAPWAKIDARVALWNKDSAEELMEGAEEEGRQVYVVDAIDNIDTKVDLLEWCVRRKVKVISSMGAGCKSDPTRICIGDISASAEDPLSRATRRRLKLKGITEGITTVYSVEKPGPGKAVLAPTLPTPVSGGGGYTTSAAIDGAPAATDVSGALPISIQDYAPLPDFRIRILPVLGTMPALFGLALANHIILTLAGYPTDYPPPSPINRHKLNADLLTSLAGLESRLRGNAPGIRVPLTEDDAGYILEEVFRGKSVVSGFATRLALCRWERIAGGEERGKGLGEADAPLTVQDVVVMTKEEVKKHEREVLLGGKSPEEVWGREVVERVEMRRREERLFSVYR